MKNLFLIIMLSVMLPALVYAQYDPKKDASPRDIIKSINDVGAKSYQVIDGSDRVTSKWVVPYGGDIGSPALKTVKSYTSTNTNPDKIEESVDYWDEYMSDLIVELVADYEAHIANSTEHETAADATNIVTLVKWGGLSNYRNLMVELHADMTSHFYDANPNVAVDRGAGSYHVADAGSAWIPPANLIPTSTSTKAALILSINNLKDVMNGHDADSTAHAAGSLYQITSDDAVDME